MVILESGAPLPEPDRSRAFENGKELTPEEFLKASFRPLWTNTEIPSRSFELGPDFKWGNLHVVNPAYRETRNETRARNENPDPHDRAPRYDQSESYQWLLDNSPARFGLLRGAPLAVCRIEGAETDILKKTSAQYRAGGFIQIEFEYHLPVTVASKLDRIIYRLRWHTRTHELPDILPPSWVVSRSFSNRPEAAHYLVDPHQLAARLSSVALDGKSVELNRALFGLTNDGPELSAEIISSVVYPWSDGTLWLGPRIRNYCIALLADELSDSEWRAGVKKTVHGLVEGGKRPGVISLDTIELLLAERSSVPASHRGIALALLAAIHWPYSPRRDNPEAAQVQPESARLITDFSSEEISIGFRIDQLRESLDPLSSRPGSIGPAIVALRRLSETPWGLSVALERKLLDGLAVAEIRHLFEEQILAIVERAAKDKDWDAAILRYACAALRVINPRVAASTALMIGRRHSSEAIQCAALDSLAAHESSQTELLALAHSLSESEHVSVKGRVQTILSSIDQD